VEAAADEVDDVAMRAAGKAVEVLVV